MTKKEIVFITGNEDKFREYSEILTSVTLKRENIDLPELQGTPKQIVEEKAILAAKKTGKPCFVDDTSLFFEDWGDLPGPYIKHFIKYMGLDKLCHVLHASTQNVKAKAITSIGYSEPGKKPVCIQGILEGSISSEPRGDKNFKKGWDQIFIPEGKEVTFGEMESEDKHAISQRKKAIILFEEFLKKNMVC